MKDAKTIFLIFIGLLSAAAGYGTDYVLIDMDRLGKPTDLHPFKLYYHEAEIKHKARRDLTWNIYNLYFARNDLRIQGARPDSFLTAYEDYKKFTTDVLISMTPLFLHNQGKKEVELSKDELAKIKFIQPEHLLQTAIRSLYASNFVGPACAPPDSMKGKLNARIKSLDYKIVLKRQKNYFVIDNETLTEFYYTDRSPAVFPYQLTLAGIYDPVPCQMFTPDYIFNDYVKQRKIHESNRWQSYRREIMGKLYCAGETSIGKVPVLNFWMTDVFADNRFEYYLQTKVTEPFHIGTGSGSFQFIRGIGIINGNYEFYLDENLRNKKTDAAHIPPPDFTFETKSINGKSPKEFSSWYLGQYYKFKPEVIAVE